MERLFEILSHRILGKIIFVLLAGSVFSLLTMDLPKFERQNKYGFYENITYVSKEEYIETHYTFTKKAGIDQLNVVKILDPEYYEDYRPESLSVSGKFVLLTDCETYEEANALINSKAFINEEGGEYTISEYKELYAKWQLPYYAEELMDIDSQCYFSDDGKKMYADEEKTELIAEIIE